VKDIEAFSAQFRRHQRIAGCFSAGPGKARDQEQTFRANSGMSAKCHERTSVSGSGSGVPYYQKSIL